MVTLNTMSTENRRAQLQPDFTIGCPTGAAQLSTVSEADRCYVLVGLSDVKNVRKHNPPTPGFGDERSGVLAVAYDPFSLKNHPLAGKSAKLVNMACPPRVFLFSESPTLIGI